jgi:energy-converting hydrogenase Eha subunit H
VIEIIAYYKQTLSLMKVYKRVGFGNGIVTLSRPSSKLLSGPLPMEPRNTRVHHRENKSRSNLISVCALAKSGDPII